ncbi:hypothetical protein FRC12_014869 [Ceratobasidium sp. 428]|nr:hypothetical protein FRC12_014869 [Ceratobasidium sp. 428]
MPEIQVDQPLQTILAQSKAESPDLKIVESSLQEIANALREKSAAATRDMLNQSGLLEALVSVWKVAATADGVRPIGSTRSTAYELLRVAANLCNDHDGNRQKLLDVGLVQSVLSALDAYGQESLELDLEDIKVAKTSVGFLLNATMKNDSMRAKFIELDAPRIVLKLSTEIYGVGSWTKTVSGEEEPEIWTWRSGLSSWARRLIDSLHDTEPAPEFAPSCLPYLIKPLDVFANQGSRTPTVTATQTSTDTTPTPSPPDLIAADLEILEASSMLLESLTLDSESIRLALAKDPAYLRTILRFIELAQPLSDWRTTDTSGREKAKWDKTVGLCKGAVIKALVTVAGEDKAISYLWDDAQLDGGNQTAPGGWFVAALLGWIKQYRMVAPGDARDDLVICATLALGNLARRDDYCIALVAPPSSVVPDLVPFIAPTTDMKVKHGVLGLLKHLAQPTPNKIVLGDAGVLEALATSNVWDSESDRAEAVQASGVGIAKHLCLNNVSNTVRLVLPPPTASSAISPISPLSPREDDDDDTVSGMDQVINLSQRSDTVALKSEAARVLANAVKSLWSPAGPQESVAVTQAHRRRAVLRLSNSQSARALAELVGRSRRYPVLLNEGIVALTLLGSQRAGAPHVLEAFVRALDIPAALVTGTKPSGDENTPIEHPTLLDMLQIILKNVEKTFPPQLRANVCTLLGSVQATDSSSTKALEKAKDVIRQVLTDIVAADADKEEPVVQTAAKKILDLWTESKE